MLRLVAASMVGRRGAGFCGWCVGWQEMDSATARGMTKLGGCGYFWDDEGGMTKLGVCGYFWNHKAVMLRVVAASMVGRRGAGFYGWCVGWREMDSATARGMTKLGGCGYFWDDEGGMTKFGVCGYSRNHKAVMLRVVAASMVGCKGAGFCGWCVGWREMDSATARGMTKLGGCGYFWDDEGGMTKFGGCGYFWNHKAVMLRLVAASMVGRRGAGFCGWCVGWREMDSATARGMTKLGVCGYFWDDEGGMTKLGGCGYFWDDEGGMTKFGVCGYSRNHKAVMLRVVAASMVGRRGAGFCG